MVIALPLGLIEVTDAPAMFDPIGGNGLLRVIVPVTPELKVIVLLPAMVLASKIAWRSDPAPLSMVFATGKFAPSKTKAFKSEKQMSDVMSVRFIDHISYNAAEIWIKDYFASKRKVIRPMNHTGSLNRVRAMILSKC